MKGRVRGDVSVFALSNVADMDEVAALAAVLEHQWRSRVRAASGRCSQRRHTACRGGIPGPYTLWYAARGRGHRVRAANAAHRCSWWSLVAAYTLRGSSGASSWTSGRQASPHDGQAWFEPAGARVGNRGRGRGVPSRDVAAIRPFAVDHHRAGQHDAAGEGPLVQHTQQLRRAEIVVRHIAGASEKSTPSPTIDA